jgi:hypothetical protein
LTDTVEITTVMGTIDSTTLRPFSISGTPLLHFDLRFYVRQGVKFPRGQEGCGEGTEIIKTIKARFNRKV